MNTSDAARLSFRYLLRYARRYLFLFCALSFGFCIVTVITAISEGISETLYRTAQSHYAGDIVCVGMTDGGTVYRRLDSKIRAAIYETIKETGLNVKEFTERTLLNDHAKLFFNGEFIDLRYLVGTDWQKEKKHFDSLTYMARFPSYSEDGIIISEHVASLLGAAEGDGVTMEVADRYGRTNTRVFVVDAIVRDKTLFGYYKAYVSKPVMNRLLSYEDDDSSMIGIYIRSGSGIEKQRRIFRDALSTKTDTAPELLTYDDFHREREALWSGIRVFVMGLSVYLADIYRLISALDMLTIFLYLMMLLIILASAAVTYRLILHERMKELGTMMAIGFSERDVRRILGAETIFLGAVSIITGFVLAVVICRILGRVPIANIPGFEILLADGRLRAIFLPLVVLINSVALYVMLFVAVGIPAARISKMPLTELLAGSMKG